jgi:hypothetical protein
VKIKIGGKYRMRAYPSEYLYVHIICKESDIIPVQTWDENRFLGVIIYSHKLVQRITFDPQLCPWGEDGGWDSVPLGNDCNDIVAEWTPTIKEPTK